MPSFSSKIDLVAIMLASALNRLETASIGEVQEYDPNYQTCTVKPLAKRTCEFMDINGPDNFDIPEPEEQQEIYHVPVLFPSMAFGLTKVCLHFPLQKGVQGLIVYCREPIKTWISTGAVYEPELLEKFRLNGAVFIPGLFSDQTAMSGLMPDRVSLTVDGPIPASISIGLNDGMVRLGEETAIEPVVLGTQLNALLSNLLSTLQASPSCKSAIAGDIIVDPAYAGQIAAISSNLSNILSQKVLTK